MGSKVDPTGHWLCQSRPCLASATAGEYALPEDDAGEAAISQQRYHSKGRHTVAYLSGFLKRIEGNLVSGPYWE